MDFKLNIQLFGDNNNDSHRGYVEHRSYEQRMKAKGYKYTYGGKWFKKESEYKAYKKAKQQEAMLDSGGGHGATDNGLSETNQHNPNVSGKKKNTTTKKPSGTLDPKNSLNLGFQNKPSKNYGDFDSSWGDRGTGSIHTPNKGGNLKLSDPGSYNGGWGQPAKTVGQWRDHVSKPVKTSTGVKLETKLSKNGIPTMDYVREMNQSATKSTAQTDVSKGGVIGGLIGAVLSPQLAGAGYWIGDKVNPSKLTYQKEGYSSLAEALKGRDNYSSGRDDAGHGNFGIGGGGGNTKDSPAKPNVDYGKITQPQENIPGTLEPPVSGVDNSLFNAIFRNKKRDSHVKGLGDVLSIFGRG